MPFSQIIKVSTGKLNTVNDAVAGASVASGTGASPYLGQLGKVVWFGPQDIRYDSATGTLYEGFYEYVQFRSGSSASNALGQVVFWYDQTNFIVTPDATDGLHAGVTLNAVSKGNYGWIQVGGRASVLFRASITKATPAIADVVVVQTGQNVADVLADATTFTSPNLKLLLGIAQAAPTGGAVSVVDLFDRLFLPS
jgi:hypothetical protein